jgi:hypothetical protein
MKKGQLELPILRPKEPDRNHHKGGRSFYFFDFDDNVAFLSTRIFLFHKITGREVALSTGEYARVSKTVGKSGPYRDYEMRLDDETGSFRRFRDLRSPGNGEVQPFIEDLLEVLAAEDSQWKGPSWTCFFHATYNQRPLSVITARGHHPETIKSGIQSLREHGHIPCEPNYLGIYPVSHPATKGLLGEETASVARLKQLAIRHSVEEAFRLYGYNPHHRFGMSDDDPHNIELSLEEMISLKKDYPEVAFFLIETQGDQHIKHEIHARHIHRQTLGEQQLAFF